YGLYLSILRSPVPTIAVLHGAALGAGLCFAMACDLRLAAPATKLGLNFVKIGLHPGMGATHLLPRLVGAAKASELLLTGRTIEAEEALRIGLVNAVHPEDALYGQARALALEIAHNAPVAVSSTARTLREGVLKLDDALDREASAQSIDYQTQ